VSEDPSLGIRDRSGDCPSLGDDDTLTTAVCMCNGDGILDRRSRLAGVGR